ncbi:MULTISPECIES: flagellar assembly peptidoglycan hydrolase FlgJ [Alteromonadaceae]|uniref:flagellar assembly peptidoglycan hydrolase FlgJ n=1 Tax=Alteromonadaceae TaxID=72275 RepID=UPI001C095584|nr:MULTISPECIES: flagellar assembly peptidoglycan hydrolase FlgJ [Aliiglaciecola]MBU2877973.1 flagellar assembly peptidoglycan hydrolase FlgJ [Aliiglaciecola lipolytica]MDO6709338.1 flagellar assembly peptidoglycan hydrolase FlgJ [Aliiglaciecola sp. 2_MG-2023]MDO6750486.1 flagellar assembly peptidoglycan hydrolase FlgJ [Aliiglaciecola sp. 1_MG-2023]
MEMNNHIDQQLELSRNVHDLKGIDNLRQAAQRGDKQALDEAAKQFEAIFVQMMLKSMRKAQDALADKDSPFNSQQVKFYRDMHDQQLAVDLSSRGGVGIADLIVQQLSPGENGFMPASAVRENANLHNMVRQASMEYSSTQNDSAAVQPSQNATKQSAFASPSEFMQTLLPHAQEIAQKIGIDPKALLAQAAVETGWGQYMIHTGSGQNTHNLFGIKADNRWQGETTAINTVEFEQGVAKQQKAQFRTYDSFADGLNDYVSFVADNPRYQQALENVKDPQAYFSALQSAGYATDPQYANKILSVLNSDTFKSALSTLAFGKQNAE